MRKNKTYWELIIAWLIVIACKKMIIYKEIKFLVVSPNIGLDGMGYGRSEGELF